MSLTGLFTCTTQIMLVHYSTPCTIHVYHIVHMPGEGLSGGARACMHATVGLGFERIVHLKMFS